MYKLSDDDLYVIFNIKKLLISLLKDYKKYKISKKRLVGLTKALYTLSNYPKISIDGFISITAVEKFNKEINYAEITISGENLQLSNGAGIYNKGVGHDHIDNIFYQSGIKTKNDIDAGLLNWIDLFKHYLEEGKLVIEDEAKFIDLEKIEGGEEE